MFHVLKYYLKDHIEKMAETMQQIQMEAVIPKYQCFAVLTLLAERGLQNRRWKIQDKICIVQSIQKQDKRAKSGLLVIFKGSI